MILSINQPAYLPWLGYFDRILSSDIHVVLDHVQFEKNSMTNRNKIAGTNGDIMLTVPVMTKHQFGDLAISTLKIDNQQKWRKKHWETIKQNYRKAPFYKQYECELSEIYHREYAHLNTLLKDQLKFFMDTLGVKSKVVFSSEMDIKSKKSDLVLDICRIMKADRYISGALGKNYLELEPFTDNNISVEFQSYEHPKYKQFNQLNFVSHLSTLDLIMNHGEESVDILHTANRNT